MLNAQVVNWTYEYVSNAQNVDEHNVAYSEW